MSIEKSLFGKMNDGREVYAYTMTNAQGASVKIISYGGAIVNLYMPDKNNNFADIVCGYDTLSDYINGEGYQGALIGRYANRIKSGRFEFKGKEYVLAKNDGGKNHLHGGNCGFDKKIWDVIPKEGEGFDTLTLTTVSPDGEEGYPGTLNVNVIYTFSDDCSLRIDYSATSDKDTVINLTNHTYFNFGGYTSGDIKGHKIKLNADYITETDDELIPTGKLLKVDGTMYDLRDFKALEGNYDDNFVLSGDSSLKLAAEVIEPESGRGAKVYTTLPGIQLYTGNMMNCPVNFKGNVPQVPHCALCLETQYFPDSPNHSSFPSCELKAGDKYESTTIYCFTVEK